MIGDGALHGASRPNNPNGLFSERFGFVLFSRFGENVEIANVYAVKVGFSRTIPKANIRVQVPPSARRWGGDGGVEWGGGSGAGGVGGGRGRGGRGWGGLTSEAAGEGGAFGGGEG